MTKNIFCNVSKEEVVLFYANISKSVREIREKKGISQLDLALEIGIKSVAFYSNCECCRYGKHFNLEHLYKISKALEVDICSFFKDS
ncbi:helix-turn-helix transcriptional regulator [uncultured Helicobacter sp.]|uniref:helix-turn-helix domain-containing protein n=1 Tax=uncultured Helicobacter sp. TaxID=175537 RepID=UPI00261D9B54|nr:helix-turn-helix transcriptional regulator [uncultured Helicobacter sp.]